MGISEGWAAQYRDLRWQRKRLEVMQRADFACEWCGAKDVPLNVHHKIYYKGRKVYEYHELDLMTLCEPCHEHGHRLRRQIVICMAEMDLAELGQLAELAEGLS